ncbi:hypothetical protein [Peribacillus butanolivorans]
MYDTWIYQHFINTVLFVWLVIGGVILIAVICMYFLVKKPKENATKK